MVVVETPLTLRVSRIWRDREDVAFIQLNFKCNIPCLIMIILTNFMEQSPWEANSHSPSQEILFLLWNPKVHYRVHRIPPLVPILSQINLVHTFSPCFPKISSSFIFLSTLRSSLHVFWQNFCKHFSSLPRVLHAPPVSSSLLWSP